MGYYVDVDLIGELMHAARNPGENQFYLDTRSGQPHILSSQLMTAVIRKDKDLLMSLPPDERSDESIAEEVLSDEELRFVPFESVESLTEFQWMSDFSEFVSTPGLYEKLQSILDVSKAMKEFYQLLDKYPAERMLWLHQFQQKRREEARAWLEEVGIQEGELLRFDHSVEEPSSVV